MDKLNRVLLVAGTHGNELSGIYLQKLIKDRLYVADRSTFNTQCVLGNPEAVKQNVRYVETDLNREFALANQSSPATQQETEIAQQFTQVHAHQENQLIITSLPHFISQVQYYRKALRNQWCYLQNTTVSG